MSRQRFSPEARLWSAVSAVLALAGVVIAYQQFVSATHTPSGTPSPPNASAPVAPAPSYSVSAPGPHSTAIGTVNGNVNLR